MRAHDVEVRMVDGEMSREGRRLAAAGEELRAVGEEVACAREARPGVGCVAEVVAIEAEEDRRLARAEERFWAAFMDAFQPRRGQPRRGGK